MKQLITISILFFLVACTEGEQVQEAFLINYQDYCGHAYEGEATLADIGGGEAFESARLIMILENCDDEMVRIPFHVDDDRSRTWIVQMKENQLYLSHDHRYEDGTGHEANFYGGFADDRGTVLKQYFPADEQTIEERPARSINTWSKEFDLAELNYYYRLYLNDELRFEAVFDLTNPLPIE
ncbi:MAG: hypothetical protein JJU37_10145 [Balneolaceae bacterium]|nr:hypothetical protein [Balneolaceae bacterium]